MCGAKGCSRITGIRNVVFLFALTLVLSYVPAALAASSADWPLIVVRQSDLTDQEMKDASAYLADKWFARTLPGYASKSGTTGTDVSAVAIKGDGCGIGVEGAGVVRVASFSADAGPRAAVF